MFTVDEILSATQGRWIGGEKKKVVFSGLSIDSRKIKPGELFIALRGDRFNGHDFIGQALEAGAAGVVFSEDRNLDFKSKVFIRVSDTLWALQEIARAHRSKFNIPLIAITGSNGKTTTKELAASILAQKYRLLKNEGNLNNHIGVPLTLLRLESTHEVAVIEMGINRPGELTRLGEIAHPQAALITNVGPTHLEFLGDVAGVARAKGELLETLTPQGVAILNIDDEHYSVLASRVKGERITFGLRPEAHVTASELNFYPDRGTTFKLRMRINQKTQEGQVALRVMGRHNVYNALAAAAVGLYLGMQLDMIRQGLEDFRPVSMRSQLLELGGFHILNDCYNANPASMRAAIETLAGLGSQGRQIAVLGDMLELGGLSEAAHREMGLAVAKAGIHRLITVGKLAREMACGALSGGMEARRVICCELPEEAGKVLLEIARPGDYILVKGSRGMKMERLIESVKAGLLSSQ